MNTNVVDNSGAASLAGYVTNEIVLDFEGILTGIQVYTGADELPAGTFFQGTGGGPTAASQFFVTTFPYLEFDTAAGFGGPISDAPGAGPTTAGSFAVDLGAAGPSAWTATKLNQAFNPPGGANIADKTGYQVARFSIADSYTGSLQFLASAGGTISTWDIPIEAGVLGGITTELVFTPAAGETIDLSDKFADFSDLLEDAVTLTGGTFDSEPTIDNPIFKVAAWDDTSIDLMIDRALASAGPGRVETGMLTALVGGEEFSWTVSAAVPEPSTFALAGLALVGLVGYARRK